MTKLCLSWKHSRLDLGRGGDLVVSVLAFYSNDPSSNPAGYLNFLYKKAKINKKRPGLAHKNHLRLHTLANGQLLILQNEMLMV